MVTLQKSNLTKKELSIKELVKKGVSQISNCTIKARSILGPKRKRNLPKWELSQIGISQFGNFTKREFFLFLVNKDFFKKALGPLRTGKIRLNML